MEESLYGFGLTVLLIYLCFYMDRNLKMIMNCKQIVPDTSRNVGFSPDKIALFRDLLLYGLFSFFLPACLQT